ncbi:hypothetical protein PILCRDRAFT_183408 [Piloderma croceum F 1598]|uniref:Uncharacterized protein n=1 Tax=Piloderma croceum (strain F 1598) TaxID=765440 RepID=A0A0C3CLA2_PILCF|nr:hypothetical protein PILCRDRAFT_183408 [Piloderma croceum F 1598]
MGFRIEIIACKLLYIFIPLHKNVAQPSISRPAEHPGNDAGVVRSNRQRNPLSTHVNDVSRSGIGGCSAVSSLKWASRRLPKTKASLEEPWCRSGLQQLEARTESVDEWGGARGDTAGEAVSAIRMCFYAWSDHVNFSSNPRVAKTRHIVCSRRVEASPHKVT